MARRQTIRALIVLLLREIDECCSDADAMRYLEAWRTGKLEQYDVARLSRYSVGAQLDAVEGDGEDE